MPESSRDTAFGRQALGSIFYFKHACSGLASGTLPWPDWIWPVPRRYFFTIVKQLRIFADV